MVYSHFLNDKEMLWISERDGWKHLYLYDVDKCAVKRQITKGEWVVKDVISVDNETRVAYLTICGKDAGEDPYFEKVYKLNIDNGELICLTPGNGNHKVVFNHDKSYLTDVYSRPDCPPVFEVRCGKTGKLIAELERGDVSKALEMGWQMPENFCAKGRDGKTDIWGTIVRPANFDPNKKYPIIEYIYAGPHDNHVPKDFAIAPFYYSNLVELGFIVVAIDGMGTYNRSKAFHDVCWKNIKDAGFPDRIAWMKAAAEKYPYMDVDRVGIFGCSAGGQNAMGALLFHPEFYKVGVAACGCHDNRMDKMWWNEQWMGYPIGPEYAENSNMENAHLLQGKLMLILGELDNNVDPSTTLQVVNELIKAKKEFEFLMLPNERHTMGGTYGERKRRDFFVRHLLGHETPDWNND
jgi:dipeptidyl aminopeptidase/acylaminoacyl peptidase